MENVLWICFYKLNHWDIIWNRELFLKWLTNGIALALDLTEIIAIGKEGINLQGIWVDLCSSYNWYT